MQKRGRPPLPPKTLGIERKALLAGNPRKVHGAPASEKDPKRRLGNFSAAGEHAIQQPRGKNGSQRFSESNGSD
jgi:hypothetical protein